jgi:hypothetical protein
VSSKQISGATITRSVVRRNTTGFSPRKIARHLVAHNCADERDRVSPGRILERHQMQFPIDLNSSPLFETSSAAL